MEEINMYNVKNNKFNELLNQYRKSRNITLEELGKKIGKSKATISKYETGEIIPDIMTLLEICNSLNVSLSELFPMESNNINRPVKNPFSVNKLYLYYYTEDILITSIIELSEENDLIFVKFYNGIKSISKYSIKSSYYYEGKMECDKTIGYINLVNTTSQGTQLEKIQISFSIPWSQEVKITSFFLLGLTPNSIPVIKKGILSSSPIKNINKYKDDLKINNDILKKIQTDNAWILENKNYSNFFFDKK